MKCRFSAARLTNLWNNILKNVAGSLAESFNLEFWCLKEKKPALVR